MMTLTPGNRSRWQAELLQLEEQCEAFRQEIEGLALESVNYKGQAEKHSQMAMGLRRNRDQLRTELIRRHRELHELKAEIAAMKAGYFEYPRLFTRLSELYKIIQGQDGAPKLPPLPSADDFSEATISFWQYSYNNLEGLYKKLSAEQSRANSSANLHRLQKIAWHVKKLLGRVSSPEPTLSPAKPPRLPSRKETDFNNPLSTAEACQRLQRDIEGLHASLQRRSVRFYRVLYRVMKKVPWPRNEAEGKAALEAVVNRIMARGLPKSQPAKQPGNCPDLISIIMPTYNRAALLRRAIGSVIQQTYNNWQLLVIDDGSTDGTAAVQDGLDDERIIWISRPHEGVCRTRNAGVTLAEGRYIAFLDCDNVWSSEFLSELHDCLSRAGDEVVAAYADLNLYLDDKLVEVMQPEFNEAVVFHKPQIDLNALLIKKEMLDKSGYFDVSMSKWVDYELMLRLMKHGRFKHHPKILGDYFRLADGITRKSDAECPMEPNLEVIRRTRRELLRVGYVQWDYPSASQAFLHREMEALQRRGHDVRIYYKERAEHPAQPEPDIMSYQIDSARELEALALSHGRHILHGHFAYPNTTLLTWPASRKTNIPFTFAAHGVDIFHRKNEIRSRLGEMGQSPHCKAVFAPGEFHKQFFMDHGIPASKIIINRTIMDPKWVGGLPPDFNRPLSRVTLLTRFVEKKGVLDYIAIARACRDLPLEFELYGYGPLEDEVRLAARGVDNLKLAIGPVGAEQLQPIYAAASVLLLPCRRAANGDMDGLPSFLIDGAASGCLLISSNLSSIPDLIQDGKTGFLAEPGDFRGYRRALKGALKLKPADLAGMREAAWQRIQEQFTPERVIEQLLATWCY